MSTLSDVKKAVKIYYKENYKSSLTNENLRKKYIDFFADVLWSLNQIEDSSANIEKLRIYIENKSNFMETLDGVLDSISSVSFKGETISTLVADEDLKLVYNVLSEEQKNLLNNRIPSEFKNMYNKSATILKQNPKYSDRPYNQKIKVIPILYPKLKLIDLDIVEPEVELEPEPEQEQKIKTRKIKIIKKKPPPLPSKLPPEFYPPELPTSKVPELKSMSEIKKNENIKTKIIVKSKKPRMTPAEKRTAKALAMRTYRQKLKDKNNISPPVVAPVVAPVIAQVDIRQIEKDVENYHYKYKSEALYPDDKFIYNYNEEAHNKYLKYMKEHLDVMGNILDYQSANRANMDFEYFGKSCKIYEKIENYFKYAQEHGSPPVRGKIKKIKLATGVKLDTFINDIRFYYATYSVLIWSDEHVRNDVMEYLDNKSDIIFKLLPEEYKNYIQTDGNSHITLPYPKAYKIYKEIEELKTEIEGINLLKEEEWQYPKPKEDDADVSAPSHSSKKYIKILNKHGANLNPTETNINLIKKEFRRLALIYHPDKNDGDDTIFKEINRAYEFLINKSTL